MLAVALGHFLDTFTLALGNVTSVSSTLRTQFPESTVFNAEKQSTEKKVPQTSADQVIFSGVTDTGVAFSFHWRAGLPAQTATSPFLWVIDGEEGSVALQNDQAGSSFINIFEPKLVLNGVGVAVEADPLGNVPRAWKEHATGSNAATIDDGVRIHRILDAIRRSAEEGKTIHL
jgi:predicted dehydrogenase